ncbi:Spo0B C-terminal domain-containing protein [Alteribacillus bidgolensis]|uniref:Stage 0 sporulation protein B (Sporulation initiation phosphotransferase) n=1 Tax=Alteribacillus bidgolensis TaxID=930129 RepID=A0A1G8N627_9BACI|nr:Spo0B C-terminal domain-containing protein [Alteribacillus bidgolensis]SDI75517.1 stage 0 sporulation protein B (sporulation initiation phosphotransferase) [Alteribacillus bidgolensis]
MDAKKQLELLNHSRHDWMNVLQIIKGNITLERYEKVEEIVEKTIQKKEHESRLTRLQMPKTAAFLLTFNWYSRMFTLDIEVTENTGSCTVYDNDWNYLITTFLHTLDRSVLPGADNQLLITIHTLEKPFLEFDFLGEIEKLEEINNWLYAFSSSSNHCFVTNVVCNEKEIFFTAWNNK